LKSELGLHQSKHSSGKIPTFKFPSMKVHSIPVLWVQTTDLLSEYPRIWSSASSSEDKDGLQWPFNPQASISQQNESRSSQRMSNVPVVSLNRLNSNKPMPSMINPPARVSFSIWGVVAPFPRSCVLVLMFYCVFPSMGF
jgi:hypothetical protein